MTDIQMRPTTTTDSRDSCPVSLTARAQSVDSMRAVYADGRFLEAAALGEFLDTSEGYSLAVQSFAM